MGHLVKNKTLYKTNNFIYAVLLLTGLTNLNAKTDDLLASISSDMEHFNDVATKTKQNEHYQPYIISVFHGKELEKLGISDLKEALSLVPGVDMATDNFNTQTPIFRGSNPLAVGQSKLFIDGTLVNNVFFDAYSEYLSLPIEMVKRIEVVRGPSNKNNGLNSYAGSINVITYAEDFKGFESKDKLVFKYGSYDYKMGGFIKNFKTSDFKIYTDFFYQKNDKKLPAGPDGLSQGALSLPGIDNSSLSQSGDAPLWMEDYSLGLNIQYKDFYLNTRLLKHTKGSAYGINLALPQESDRVRLPNYYIELGYKTKNTDYELNIKVGIKQDTFDSKTKLAPDGLVLIDIPRFSKDPTDISLITFTKGAYGEHLAKQQTLYQSSYFWYNGICNHKVMLGYRFSQEKTIDMTTKVSNWSTGAAELVDYTDSYPFFDKNAKRNTMILSLQDEYQLSNNLSFIYGLNYEQTSYKDAGVEPSMSMVYKLDTNNILKAMYNRSHRNASWQEMFAKNNRSRVGHTKIDTERVDAFEAAYVKKFSNDSHLQANLFYLLNKNQIYNSVANPLYRNVVDTDIYGFEFEYKGNITSSDKVYFNYSYVDGKSYITDEGTNEELPNVANHILKAYYLYEIDNNFSFSSVAKYVGSKSRVLDDARKKVKAYTTLDSTIRYEDPVYNYTLGISVKNIFNSRVSYPSTPNTYIQDYEQERRNFMLTFTKEF